jgi:ABC-type multidrug transport system ATPase subunit
VAQTEVPRSLGGLSPLSQTLWKETTDTNTIGNVSAWLTWQELSVTVSISSGETQTVLQGLIGYAEPGTLMALMGPSGSGKSTLLDALAGRLASNVFQSGSIKMNGHRKKLSFITTVCLMDG